MLPSSRKARSVLSKGRENGRLIHIWRSPSAIVVREEKNALPPCLVPERNTGCPRRQYRVVVDLDALRRFEHVGERNGHDVR